MGDPHIVTDRKLPIRQHQIPSVSGGVLSDGVVMKHTILLIGVQYSIPNSKKLIADKPIINK